MRINDRSPKKPGEPYLLGSISEKSATPNEDFPIVTDSTNIGQQFADKVVRTSDAMRKRGLPREYSLTQQRENSKTHRMDIYHEKDGHVGFVGWNPKNGYVHGVEIQGAHQPKVNQLLAAAWDYSREAGIQGPAWSDNLSVFGGKMVERVNPESEGLKRSNYYRARISGNRIISRPDLVPWHEPLGTAE